MTPSLDNPPRFVKSRINALALAACALAAWALAAAPAAAHETGEPHTHTADDPTATYHVDFTTDYNLILDPNDPIAQHFAMWKTPTQMASLLSAPFLRVTNDASSSLQLTKLRIDLGTAGYAFDSFAFFEQPDDGNAQIVSHTDLAFGGDMRPFLDIEFPSGLNPGDSFTFQVRLARLIPAELGGSGLASYDEVLWQQENQANPNRLDNALVSAQFQQEFSSGLDLTVNMTPVRLFEFSLANQIFPVDINGASGNAFALPNNHYMMDVGFVRFSQTVQVPEPGSLLLAALGSLGLVAGRWQRGRRQRARAA